MNKFFSWAIALNMIVCIAIIVYQCTRPDPVQLSVDIARYIIDEPLTARTEPMSNHELIRKVFGDQADMAIAIAYAESAMNPKAIGDKHLRYRKHGKLYGDSIGLFQIRTFPDRPDRALLMDPYFNVHYAHKLYRRCGWKAWGAYVNKSYKQFLRPKYLARR